MAKNDLADKFSEFAGRKDQYDVREVEGVDGKKQTQLIDKTTGSISAVFEGDVDVDKITGSVTSTPAVAPKEAVEDGKKEFTDRGAPITPTQPEALQAAQGMGDIDHSDKSGVAEDAKAAPGESQRSTKKQREQ